jgi:hypothetical protein
MNARSDLFFKFYKIIEYIEILNWIIDVCAITENLDKFDSFRCDIDDFECLTSIFSTLMMNINVENRKNLHSRVL